jgi:hypothetical protein
MEGQLSWYGCCCSPHPTVTSRKSSVFPARLAIAANPNTPEPFQHDDDAIFDLAQHRIMSVMRPFSRVATRTASSCPSCVRTFASSTPRSDEPKRSDVFGGIYRHWKMHILHLLTCDRSAGVTESHERQSTPKSCTIPKNNHTHTSIQPTGLGRRQERTPQASGADCKRFEEKQTG